MKKTDRLILVGVLVSGAIALMAFGAMQPKPTSGSGAS